METIFMEDATFTASVHYEDPKAALDWLVEAFGFEVTMAIDGPPEAPHACHYELALEGRGRLMVGGQWREAIRSPKRLGGTTTQTIHVQLLSGLDEHCERARAAGAVIDQEPEEQFYGDRTYRAFDPEGHLWTFGQHVRDVSRAEAEAALGQPITSATWE
ncbi:MAG TPA: VOC family protein [Acidimicrobiales bacterium]|nr:VOC family protein [Acidimicrobiales bacterium]